MKSAVSAFSAWWARVLTPVPAWFVSLYRRPWLFLGLLLITPLVSVCLWLSIANERQWRARESDDLAVTAQLAARIVEDELTRTHQIERAITAREDFQRAVRQRDAATLRTFLDTLSHITPMMERAAVLDPAGRVMAGMAGGPESLEGLAPAPLDALRAYGPPGPEAPSVSDVYVGDQAAGDKVVLVSCPIRDEERVLGVLQIQYRLEEVARWIEKVRVEPDGFVYVTDRRGYLVAYPFQVLPGRPKNVSDWPPVSATVHPDTISMLHFPYGAARRPWTAAVVELEASGWRVIAQQPDASMLRPFYHLVGSFVAVTLVLALFIGMMVLRWSQLHQATLRLLEQQGRLLRQSEQRRVAASLQRRRPPPPGGPPGLRPDKAGGAP